MQSPLISRLFTSLHPHRRVVLSSLCVLLVLGGCAKHEERQPDPEPTVQGEQLSFPGNADPVGLKLATVAGQAGQAINVPGRLVWDEDRTARVYAPYAGRIEKLRVAVGEAVTKGQLLADMASPDIGQAQADLQKAEADLQLAKNSLERARELSEGGVVARKDVQQAEADYARAQAESGRTKARLAQYGVASKSITQRLSLAAPLTGVVVERNANPGGEVRSEVQGPPLFIISSPESLWAMLDVDESQLASFKAGDAIDLHTAAWPDIEFKARVTSVGAGVDPTSRSVKVRLMVPNLQRRLKAEMFVTATALQASSLPTVPVDAVFLRGDKPFVFVQMAPGRFERRSVRLRPAGPQFWTVLQGVNTGERVVVGGSLYFNQILDAAK